MKRPDLIAEISSLLRSVLYIYIITFKRESSKPAVHDCHTTTRLPMAKSRNWFVPTERISFYHWDWLLLFNWGSQSSLFMTYGSISCRDSGQWQWTAIFITRVYWLWQTLKLLPFDKQSTIPTEQWAGWKRSSDSESPTQGRRWFIHDTP